MHDRPCSYRCRLQTVALARERREARARRSRPQLALRLRQKRRPPATPPRPATIAERRFAQLARSLGASLRCLNIAPSYRAEPIRTCRAILRRQVSRRGVGCVNTISLQTGQIRVRVLAGEFDRGERGRCGVPKLVAHPRNRRYATRTLILAPHTPVLGPKARRTDQRSGNSPMATPLCKG